MNKICKILVTLISLAAVISGLCMLMPTAQVAAEKVPSEEDKIGTMTVVYLRDNGTGDGSDYANAVGTLEDAYMMLDLSQDCTIVVCDRFTQINARFTIGKPYTGSVTVTSCYGGYDYRKVGAVFEFDPFRYVCWGATTFRNINFYTPGTNMLVVGQHNPVTIAEGVSIKGDQMTGSNIAHGFCILGGYQNGQDNPPPEDNSDTYITVMSGQNVIIVPFSRQVLGTYEGTAHVKIGGNAKVSVLHGYAAAPDGVYAGDVECEITDNAYIKNFYGVTQDTNAGAYTLNWKSGTIEAFNWICPNTPSKSFYPSGELTLNASPLVKSYENYDSMKANFDKLGDAAQDPEYVIPANPDSATPGKDILNAPTTTVTPTPPRDEQTGNSTSESTSGAGEDNNTSKNTAPAQTKPEFTRGGQSNNKTPEGSEQGTNAGSADNDGGNNREKGGEKDRDNTVIILIVVCAAVAAVGAVVIIVIVKAKKNNG